LGIGYWVLGIGYWLLDAGYSILDAGYSILDARCLMLNIGWGWSIGHGAKSREFNVDRSVHRNGKPLITNLLASFIVSPAILP
jgi:hypothetical protein